MKAEDWASLSPGARRLLGRLRQGGSLAVPSVYPGALTFSDHARVFVESAIAVCRSGAPPDFAVFAGLYCLRHGLELWLKCVLRNEQIDRFLLAAFRDLGRDLVQLQRDLPEFKPRKRHDPFGTALCVVQNVLERDLRHPECWSENHAPDDQQAALVYLRSLPEMRRSYFANVCRVQIPGHRLGELWTQARRAMESGLHRTVVMSADGTLGSGPGTLDSVEDLCHLLDHLDGSGDVFRYPERLSGTPNIELPPMNLEALAQVGEDLNQTVMAYTSVRTEAYDDATVGRPCPF